MAAKQFFVPYPAAFNSHGAPAPGAKAYFYLTGTTTKAPIYSDSGLSVEAENPAVADGIGQFPTIYLDGDTFYRLRITDRNDVQLAPDMDPYQPGTFYAAPSPVTVTSAPGQAVSSRTLLAGISSPANGQLALLTEAGREGQFVFSNANLSARVTGDPSQAIYVAPSSATTGASGAWVRVRTSGVYFATWFGYKGDGATSDYTAWQRMMDYLGANGGGVVYLPSGVSILDGALQDTAASNAQVVFPKITSGSQAIGIRFVGPALDQAADPNGGAIVLSTLTSGTNGAMFGVKASGSGRSEICVTFENVIFRQPQNPALTALNFSYCRAFRLINCRVDVQNVGDGTTIAEPMHADSYGIKTPLNNISSRSDIDAQVTGFYTGFLVGELVYGNLTASFCKTAIISQTGSHRSAFNCFVYACKRIIYGDQQLEIDSRCSVEHNPALALPAWVLPRWTDIEDPSGNLRGTFKIAFHDAAVAPLDFGTSPAPLNLDVEQIPSVTTEPNCSFGFIFPTITSNTNASSARLHRGLNGGIPWDIKQNTFTAAGTTGTLWVLSATNGGATGPDYRLGQISFRCDGSKDRGRWSITTWRDGVAKVPIEADSTGTTIFTGIITAADDTAAATAGVPLKGLYMHSDGTPRIRVT